MKLKSTKGLVSEVSFEKALFKGLPDDNGLYIPIEIPVLDSSFFKNIESLTFQDIAVKVADRLLNDEIPSRELEALVRDAMNFEVPLHQISNEFYCLELFHGPSLAFKDFGARFMARIMSWFLQKQRQEINILVATSGDTGSAVAQGFFQTPGIKVTILYPSGKVSPTQEKQLTTLGHNITALEVDGTFDDCQRLVKEAFLDEELKKKLNLSSANSINIARLIPQSFYYFEAYARLKHLGRPIVFCVPSGNYGNLCGGLIAANMGLPVKQFIAASNKNDIVPKYLETGVFHPLPSVQTVSNAMDVGNPSNFPRLQFFTGLNYESMRAKIWGYSVSDEVTRDRILQTWKDSNYLICPHTAVGLEAANAYQSFFQDDSLKVVLGTAHPAKFSEVVEESTGHIVQLPKALAEANLLQKQADFMTTQFQDFKSYLLSQK